MAISPLAFYMSMQPQAPRPAQASVAPTDMVSAFRNSTEAANQQYLAKLQQQNALWGGLASIGSAALMAKMLRGGSLFGSPAASEAPVDLGNAVFNNGVQTGITGVGPTAAGLPAADSAVVAGESAAAPDAALAGGDALAAGVPGVSAPAIGSAFDAGTAAVPFLDAGTAAGAGLAGDVGATVGADAALAGGADAAAAGGMTLADILPFLFMAA